MNAADERHSRPSIAWFTVLLVVVACLAGGPVRAESDKILADDAFARAESGDLIIIDVRSPYEWRQTGVPAGAARATVHNPRGLAGFLEEVVAIVGEARSKPIALICARGWRSAAAAKFLQEKGFTNVFDVSEGMLGRDANPGWLARKLPVEPCDDC